MSSSPKIQPKVSILIPIYGVEKYIERCTRSVLEQTFFDIEYIFVNDCSTDNSIFLLENIIQQYPERQKTTRVIHHSSNKGIAASRKTALEAASGEYILFVDADDYIDTDMVETLYKKATDTNADVVLCSFFDEYSNKTIEHHIQPTNSKTELMQKVFAHPSFWNKLFKRKLLTENNINLLDGINYGEDLTVTPRLIYYSSIVTFVEKPLYHYVHYNSNSFTQTFSSDKITQTLQVIQFLSVFFENKPEYEKAILYLKAIRKAKIIRSGNTGIEYITLYPEILCQLNKLDLDNKTKTILLLARKNACCLLKLYVSMLLSISRIINPTKKTT